MIWKRGLTKKDSKSNSNNVNRKNDIYLKCDNIKNNFTFFAFQKSNSINFNPQSQENLSENNDLSSNQRSLFYNPTLLTILIVLIITGIGVFGFFKQKKITNFLMENILPEFIDGIFQPRSSEKPLENVQWKSYQNQEYSCTINYDRTWKIDDKNKIMTGEIVSFYPTTINENNQEITTIKDIKVTMTIEPINTKMSLDEYSQYLLTQIDRQGEQNLQISEHILNNQKGRQISFDYIDENGQKITYRSLWILDNYKAYRIDYIGAESDFDQFQPIVEEMINSFNIYNSHNSFQQSK